MDQINYDKKILKNKEKNRPDHEKNIIMWILVFIFLLAIAHSK